MTIVLIQIDILAIILLAIIYSNNITSTNTTDNRYFTNVLISTGIIFALDLLMFVLDGKSVFLNTLVTFLYYVFTPVVGFMAMVYLYYKSNQNEKKLRKICMHLHPIIVVYMLLCIVSLKTGWIFKVNENAIYVRGDYFWLSEVLSFSFLLVPTISAVKVLRRTNDKTARKTNSSILYLLIAPLIGAVIQFFVYGVSTNWIGTLISIFIMFVNFQNTAITTDSLTGINNRRVLYRHLESNIDTVTENQRLIVFSIDVDGFKTINDTFGHAEGDAALIYIAQILKESCMKHNDFLARLGGDEFTIVCIRSIDENTDDLLEIIYEKVTRFNELACAPYKLSFSIGSAEYGEADTKTVDNLMKKADNEMYRIKKQKRPIEGEK